MIGLNVRARRAALGTLVPLLLVAACKKGGEAGGEIDQSWTPNAPDAVMGVPKEQLAAALQQRLAAARPAPLSEDQWRHVRSLYRTYGDNALWYDEDGLDRPRTGALMRALANALDDGLGLDRYPLGALGQSLATVRDGEKVTAEELAQADVLLTASFAALGEDMLTGQVNPKTLSQDWHINPLEEHVDSALTRALRDTRLDESIALMRPQDEDYDALRKELVRFRQTATRGGWNTVPVGKALKPGETDSPERLAALRERLRAEGIVAGDSAAAAAGAPDGRAVYDRALAGAVAQFQARHGIVVDSILGPGTVESLNVPATYRLGQIAANLERYRWLPRSLGARYIMVNVPAFRLEAYEQGRKALDMKVIVGAEYEDRNTPVFADSMQYVVFRPYWNVTPDIQRKEIEPKVAEDPSYMERNNYEYWNDHGETRIRQKPGDKNSLGLIKFMFPNDFNIYLHDTPEDGLFEKDVRAFSHGCIRLEKPVQLAQFVLDWSPDRVREQMESGPNNKSVALPRKIPVYIVYFTTYMRNGQLHFGNDLYKRDDALVQAVAGGTSPSPEALRAVEVLRKMAADYAD